VLFRSEPPRYGERLPGYVPPPPAPPTAPPPAGSAPAPYGAPAPGYGYPPPGYGYPVAPPAGPRRRRGWDVGLTIALLAVGFFGMLAGLGAAPMFADPTFGAQLADLVGGGSIDFGAFPVVLAVSHVVLYLVALGASIPLLVSGRAVAFWIPLAAGVLAAVVFWGGYLGVVFAQIDPTQVPGL
jgi:hypothetical protein